LLVTAVAEKRRQTTRIKLLIDCKLKCKTKWTSAMYLTHTKLEKQTFNDLRHKWLQRTTITNVIIIIIVSSSSYYGHSCCPGYCKQNIQ